MRHRNFEVYTDSFNLKVDFIFTELKTLELDTLNPDRLIRISTVETFNFIVNTLSLDITFPSTCNNVTFDNKYRYDAISIGLISD